MEIKSKEPVFDKKGLTLYGYSLIACMRRIVEAIGFDKGACFTIDVDRVGEYKHDFSGRLLVVDKSNESKTCFHEVRFWMGVQIEPNKADILSSPAKVKFTFDNGRAAAPEVHVFDTDATLNDAQKALDKLLENPHELDVIKQEFEAAFDSYFESFEEKENNEINQ